MHGVEVTNLDTGAVTFELTDEPAAKRQKRVATQAASLVQARSQANATLAAVKKEKGGQAGELEGAKDGFQTQILFTDRLQSKIAGLAELALAHGASLSDVNRIRN